MPNLFGWHALMVEQIFTDLTNLKLKFELHYGLCAHVKF